MQVSAIDQIGHTPPTHARAYGERARTSNQSMNIPSDVSESSGKEGKSNRQDLPIKAHKVDGAEHGRPLTAPAGLTQALEKLSQKGAERPDANGLAIAHERIQSNIDRYMAQVAAVMPSASPAPDVPSVDTTT